MILKLQINDDATTKSFLHKLDKSFLENNLFPIFFNFIANYIYNVLLDQYSQSLQIFHIIEPVLPNYQKYENVSRKLIHFSETRQLFYLSSSWRTYKDKLDFVISNNFLRPINVSS